MRVIISQLDCSHVFTRIAFLRYAGRPWDRGTSTRRARDPSSKSERRVEEVVTTIIIADRISCKSIERMYGSCVAIHLIWKAPVPCLSVYVRLAALDSVSQIHTRSKDKLKSRLSLNDAVRLYFVAVKRVRPSSSSSIAEVQVGPSWCKFCTFTQAN